MRLSKVIILMFIAFLVSATITSLFYVFYVITDIIEFDMDVEIGNKVGFNLDPDAIHFGTIFRGNKGMRYLTINHSKNRPIKIIIKATKGMGEWLDYSDNYFLLEKNNKKMIILTLNVPKDASFGKYYGKLRVYIKRKFP